MSFPSLDGHYDPFDNYPGYGSMAPCMRDCEDGLFFNGCDNSACWCKKNNLDRRISSLTRCASTACTFADLNTQTDVDILSGIQVSYCVDKGLSPTGMSMPSTVEASATDSGSPSETGASSTENVTSGTGPDETDTGSATSPGSSSGPSNTSGSDPTNSSSPPTSTSSSGMSTAAKAGIAIGAVFCVLLAILIVILLLRRRKRQHDLPPSYPPPTSTPYSNTGPYAPPPLQQPAPLHIPPTAGFAGSKADVSPIEEKAPGFAVSRKEVGGGQGTPVNQPAQPVASPAPTSRSNMPMEVPGSMPPARHEMHAEQAPVYQQSGQGPWAYELGTGR
ncbi:hypothetical protein N0V90_005870 [Kalmusia sp. IMI 367209]|nr:hypothetical protein N0V90_005870 [Kalmusia sp. IMI 367209]